MNLKQKSVMFLATGCFIGNIPFAPGTFGSILGLPLCFLLCKIDWPVAVLLTVIFVFFAIWIAHKAENILNTEDPGCIVIDEIAGILVTFTGLPFNIISIIFGFLIFRTLDIWKPYPIPWMERHLSGGAGIVMDDVAAGILSNLLLRVILIFHN
ncbi:MAG: phosphatidylglycerophosphatase A [Deltaproteobacteria bacterium]|nr:phosphatidylglycerophosphatase A [Deltaproteobacteria bacterium]MBW1959341.1 phosphatidylglycerophosphatase A [Deltaproteobacteria bacterium]MBW2089988.1 phosphatidylglycerophosphatase A [Deltaproteobacteria bacterium]